MKSLFGLLCVLIIIYGLFVIFSPVKELDIYEIEKDTREALFQTLTSENGALSAKMGEENTDSKGNVFSEGNEIVKAAGGLLSGAKDYLLSALGDYEEILMSDEDNQDRESEDLPRQTGRGKTSSEKNKIVAISIYEDILGLKNKGESGRRGDAKKNI